MGDRRDAYENWDRLVRATLQKEKLRHAGKGHDGTSGDLAGAVPPSLEKTTNIDAILQAADEIQDEDPNVARILCEQAYTMAKNLDPNSIGRGVLQFKTGLMYVIEQKLAKKDGSRIDRNRDIERLWEFYQSYKRRHRVDDIQKIEERWRESGTFTTRLGEQVPWVRLEPSSSDMKKVYTTLRALVEVMEVLSKDGATDGVGRLIAEELRRIKKSDAALLGELTSYNIVPLDAPALTNAIEFFPEGEGGCGLFIGMDEVANEYSPGRVQIERRVDEMRTLLEEMKQEIKSLRESVEAHNVQPQHPNYCSYILMMFILFVAYVWGSNLVTRA